MAAAGLRIVLVEPAGPINLGAIARVMKNFGLHNLVLVNPQCHPLSPEALKMAVHAKDILQSAILVSTLSDALHGCVKAIATTARVRDCSVPLEDPRQALPWLLQSPHEEAALIFGREDRGLSNEELNYAQRLIRIPTSADYSSLNLATAVGICCYELSQHTELVVRLQSRARELAPLDLMETYYDQLESLLLDIGYLYPHTAASRMEKFRYLYNRAELQNHDVAMLLGVLRQVEWAIKNRGKSENY